MELMNMVTHIDNLPNPGSPEAVEMGCLCPERDNGNGAGCYRRAPNGEPQFIHDPDCPLHGVVRRKV